MAEGEGNAKTAGSGKTDWRYDVCIELLEDLHTGTGSGNMLIDGLLYRDDSGRPVIDGDHFTGVLKDNALRLKKIGQMQPVEIESLFGTPGRGRAQVHISSLVADEYARTLVWESSAREPDSLKSEDNSLRTVEHLAAGTRLKGYIDLSNQDDTGLAEALECVMRFTNRLGGDRTRGSGLIRWQPVRRELALPQAGKDVVAGATRMRLLLRSKEPVCIPVSGYAGNIIRTASYLPGRVLRAACTAWLHERGGGLDDVLNPGLVFCNACPVPASEEKRITGALGSVDVLPFPLHLYLRKPVAGNGQTAVPHWVGHDANLVQLEQLDLVNRFADEDTPADRPKGHIYLYREPAGTTWRYTQLLGLRMKNRRGPPFGRLKKEETDLYTVERIPANTLFIADVMGEASALEKLGGHLLPWLAGEHYVGVGRGRAPLAVVDYAYLTSPASLPSSSRGTVSFTLTLVSDCIARGDNLGFLDSLQPVWLCREAGMDAGDAADIDITPQVQTEEQGAFNFASSLPRPPVLVLRRGSTFRIAGNKAAALRKKLQSVTTLGERAGEGYGRFVIDLDWTGNSVGTGEALVTARSRDAALEDATRAAESFVTKIRGQNRNIPSKQQLYQLLDALIRCQRSREHMEDVIGRFKQAAGKSGGRAWGTLFSLELDKKLGELEPPAAIQFMKTLISRLSWQEKMKTSVKEI